MSSLKPCPAAASSGDLPADVLYEILLRIPAKELCCLRAVCPSWRTLTSNPLFITAHKSRHNSAPPLLAIAYRDDSGVNGVAISDISGNVVKRIPSTGYEIVLVNESSGDAVGKISSKGDGIRVVRTRLDLVFFNWFYHSRAFWVLNPATGATITLPTDFSEELVHELEVEGIDKLSCQVQLCAFGQVSSCREYKALRVSTIGERKVCEIITFNDMNHGSWRRKQDPPSHICTSRNIRCVVVNGVVYFLMNFCSSYFGTRVITIEPCSIASFNLDTEEWGVLHGPQQVQRFVQGNEGYNPISLAELNGCLVMVHNIQNISMDLWFLTDYDKCIWVKKYGMPSHVALPGRYPFLMLDDGRIFFNEELQGILGNGDQREGFLRSYDPINDTYPDSLKLRDSKFIGIYTGSLLSL